MNDEQTYFIIGSETSEFLKVEVLNYIYPDDTDWHAGNLLKAKIQIKVGGFSASFFAELEATSFGGFKNELRRIYHDPKGITQFYSLEDWIIIKLKADGLGNFEVLCYACDFPPMGNKLEFELKKINQTYLTELTVQLNKILEKFPVKGT
jgi:hypothetical protein